MIAVTVIAVFVGLASCGDGNTGPAVDNGGNGNGVDEQGPNEVWMIGQSFNRTNLEVAAGTTVTWDNRSNEVHTVTSGSNRNHDGLFDSGNIAPGETYNYTFNETGVYDYFCIPHTGMSATITVVQ